MKSGDFTMARSDCTLFGMPASVFGLEIPDEIAEAWRNSPLLVIGEVRDDGAIDLMLALDRGTMRYLATLAPRDGTGEISAPTALARLEGWLRQVLETNEPIVRHAAMGEDPLRLSAFPLIGQRTRVVVLFERGR